MISCLLKINFKSKVNCDTKTDQIAKTINNENNNMGDSLDLKQTNINNCFCQENKEILNYIRYGY